MSDPLGASLPNQRVVDIANLKRWSGGDVPDYDITVDDPSNMRKSPFPWDDDLNRKIVLWLGDISQLNAEAIINSTNEAMTDRNPTTDRIFSRAGSALKQEVRNEIKTCRTGEAKLTKGYKLPARYVIHTVGPRYNIKYKTAAESALFNCYRHVLQIVRENNILSVALCCVHSLRRGYPPYEGAHIAIRTVRRFLEKFGHQVQTIVFVLTRDDEDVYVNLMPLYFPRSKNEEDFAAYHLPYDVGSEDGEPTIPDRQIRIMAKPILEAERIRRARELEQTSEFMESVNINEAFDMSVAVGKHAFSQMEGDIDKQRKQRLKGHSSLEATRQEQNKRYERWLRRSKQEDLTDISQLRCLFPSGFDRHGRPVIVFIGRLFPAQRVNLEKSLMHLIQTMDSLVANPYVFVYFHTLVAKENMPMTEYIKDVYNIIDHRYKKNLKAFYVVHPTFWSKVHAWFFTTFSISDVKSKVFHIPGLEYLYSRISPDQLDLPSFILDHDLKVNGTRYYTPEEDQTIGGL